MCLILILYVTPVGSKPGRDESCDFGVRFVSQRAIRL